MRQRPRQGKPEGAVAQTPATADPAMSGSRNRTSVVNAPHRTPAKPAAMAGNPPAQAAAAKSSAAASVNADNIGRAGKLPVAPLENGSASATSTPAAPRINPSLRLRGSLPASP